MKSLFIGCLIGTGLVCAQAFAGTTPPADLPPAAVAEGILAMQPMVKAAEADVRGAQAEQSRLKAGGYEYGVKVMGQRRNVAGGPNYSEWNATLERGLRLPGKAGLDQRIGEQGVLEATERVADARHEAGRQLLSMWYATRQATLEAGLWRKQVELLTQQKRIVEVRVKRGDGTQLEQLQAEAALSQAMSMSAVAEAKERAALAELQARFPGLPAPDDSQAAPPKPDGTETTWLDLMLAHNHELLAIQRAAEKARLQAQRAEADRVPDPTVGLYVANEQGGNDRIVGLSLAVPLPGEARRSQARVQLAKAEAMSEMEAATRRRLMATSAGNWQRATAGVDSWQRLDEAARAVVRHADLARRANELGELGLSDALLARRAALDAELAAGQARLSANEAVARLMLDAHQLWFTSGDDEHQ